PATALEALDVPPSALVAVAVAIERPGNLGAIARTACAAGVDAFVVVDPRTDLFHPDTIRGSGGASFTSPCATPGAALFPPDTIRVSVGAVFRLPCATARTARVLAWLRRREIRIVATTPAA